MNDRTVNPKTTLVDGEITTGYVVRHVLYGQRTGTSYALTDDLQTDATIRQEAEKREARHG